MLALARLPEELVIAAAQDNDKAQQDRNVVTTGLLLKQEGDEPAILSCLELRGSVLSCFPDDATARTSPHLATSTLNLKCVTSLRPAPEHKFAVVVAVPTCSWVLTADSEDDWLRWLHALTRAGVPYEAVVVEYKRMLLLHNCPCERATDVRLVLSPKDTVGEIVAHIFNCFVGATDAPRLRAFAPEDYVLRVEDAHRSWSKLVAERNRAFDDFAFVREAQAAKQMLRLHVIHGGAGGIGAAAAEGGE